MGRAARHALRSGRSPLVRAQGTQDGTGGPRAAGHGALDGRGVAVVAGDVQPVAQVDRLPQAQRRDGGRLGLRNGDRGQVLEVAGADPVQAATSARTSASRVGARLELATSARPFGLYAGWASLSTTLLTSRPPGAPRTSSGSPVGEAGSTWRWVVT